MKYSFFLSVFKDTLYMLMYHWKIHIMLSSLRPTPWRGKFIFPWDSNVKHKDKNPALLMTWVNGHRILLSACKSEFSHSCFNRQINNLCTAPPPPRLIKCFTVRFTEHIYEITLWGSALFDLNDSRARESCLNLQRSWAGGGGRRAHKSKGKSGSHSKKTI